MLALLFDEAGTKAARAAAARGGLPGFTSFFTFIEMEAAFSRHMAEGSLSKELLPDLRLQAQRLEDALAVLWPDSGVTAEARRLVLELGLRPGDALQAASASLAHRNDKRVAFASLDARLNRAVEAIGLPLAL